MAGRNFAAIREHTDGSVAEIIVAAVSEDGDSAVRTAGASTEIAGAAGGITDATVEIADASIELIGAAI